MRKDGQYTGGVGGTTTGTQAAKAKSGNTLPAGAINVHVATLYAAPGTKVLTSATKSNMDVYSLPSHVKHAGAGHGLTTAVTGGAGGGATVASGQQPRIVSLVIVDVLG